MLCSTRHCRSTTRTRLELVVEVPRQPQCVPFTFPPSQACGQEQCVCSTRKVVSTSRGAVARTVMQLVCCATACNGLQGRGVAGRGQYKPTTSVPQPRPAAHMHAPASAQGQRPAQYGAPQGGYAPQQHMSAPTPAADGYSGMAGRAGGAAGRGRGAGRGQQQCGSEYFSILLS